MIASFPAADALNAGDRTGPYDLVLQAEMGVALAVATGDSNPRSLEGTALPPTLLATHSYPALAHSGSPGTDRFLLLPVVTGRHAVAAVTAQRAR